MPKLMDKLRMMDGAGKGQRAPASPPQERSPQPLYHVRETLPVSFFCPFRHALQAPLLASVFGETFPKNLTPEDFLFLDTETTGLSGGVGTLAFQIGIGYWEDNCFVVEQFFIRDYDEEATMLKELAARISRFSVLVSFNGRTFDIPLLKSRFLINRLAGDCFSLPHADLLYPARRLWKLRLGSCRLSSLEEALLGISREDDLPGALVPQTYFQYLKDRRIEPIQRILMHNRQDIVSLAQLFFFLCKEYDRPEEIAHPQDLLSLARFYEKQGQGTQATKCYRLCAHGITRPQAFEALALQHKRQGKLEQAMKLYAAMIRRGDRPAIACEALAKLYEHQLRDIPKALHYTRQALLHASEPRLFADVTVQEKRSALQYRYARLQRKQAGNLSPTKEDADHGHGNHDFAQSP